MSCKRFEVVSKKILSGSIGNCALKRKLATWLLRLPGYHGNSSLPWLPSSIVGCELPSMLDAVDADLLSPLVDKSSVDPLTGVFAPARALACKIINSNQKLIIP